MRRHKHCRGSTRATNAAQHAVVTRDAEAKTTMLLGDGHAQDAHIKEALDHPLRDLLLLIDLDGWMFVAQIHIELSEQFLAARVLVGRLSWVREDKVLPEVAPENVLHKAHRCGIWPKHLLRLLNLLAILLRDVLQVLGEIGLGHSGLRLRVRGRDGL